MSDLADTDWVVDYLIGRPPAVALLERLITDGLAISIISYTEIYQGIYFGRDPAQRERDFRTLLARIDVLTISRSIARRAARIRGVLHQQGLPLAVADILIAATAIQNDLELVTRNLRHYRRISDLKLYDYQQPATSS